MTADPRGLFERLATARVEVVLVGGLAAVALGVPIVTQDIDLCFNPEPENLARLAQARMLPFRLDDRTLQRSRILTLQTDIGALDLLTAINGVGEYQEVRFQPRSSSRSPARRCWCWTCPRPLPAHARSSWLAQWRPAQAPADRRR